MSSRTPTSPLGTSKPKSATYAGRCHCGAVQFSMKLSPPVEQGSVTSCNCSICRANGYLMVYPLDNNVVWERGGDDSTLTSYTFASGKITHSFCRHCGTSICAMSNDPAFFADNRAVNVRTLIGVDLEKLRLREVDGKSR